MEQRGAMDGARLDVQKTMRGRGVQEACSRYDGRCAPGRDLQTMDGDRETGTPCHRPSLAPLLYNMHAGAESCLGKSEGGAAAAVERRTARARIAAQYVIDSTYS